MIVMTLIMIEDHIEIAGPLKEDGHNGRPPERAHHPSRGNYGRDYTVQNGGPPDGGGPPNGAGHPDDGGSSNDGGPPNNGRPPGGG